MKLSVTYGAAGRIDPIPIENLNRYKVAGRRSLTGFIPCRSENEIIKELPREILRVTSGAATPAAVSSTTRENDKRPGRLTMRRNLMSFRSVFVVFACASYGFASPEGEGESTPSRPSSRSGSGPVPVSSQTLEEMLARSIAVKGNLTRMHSVLQKLSGTDPVRIGFIGGSVTAGGAASVTSNRFRMRITEWFATQFNAPVEHVCAALGGTGSHFAAYRVQRDLLERNPDIVFVEFSVNDSPTEFSTITMEGLVRQILQKPNRPAVVMIGMLKKDGTSAQEFHVPVARHYAIPFISVRDALWPEITSGRLNWDELFVDRVHPGDGGHSITASIICKWLESIKKLSDRSKWSEQEVASPAYSVAEDFATTALIDAEENRDGVIRVLSSKGWTVMPDSRHGSAWQSSDPGSEFRVTFSGKRVALLCYCGIDAGAIEVSIDGNSFSTRDLFSTAVGINSSCVLELADDLESGPHSLTVRHSAATHPGSRSDRVEVRMVMVAGFKDL